MMSFALPAHVLPAPPKKAKRVAPPAPVVLPVLRDPVAPDAVCDRLDRFKCVPYAAVLTASACVERQGRAKAQKSEAWGAGSGRLTSQRLAAKSTGHYEKCVGCPVGAGIAKRLKLKPTAPSVAEKTAAHFGRIREESLARDAAS
jgi:hypothetical protein